MRPKQLQRSIDRDLAFARSLDPDYVKPLTPVQRWATQARNNKHRLCLVILALVSRLAGLLWTSHWMTAKLAEDRKVYLPQAQKIMRIDDAAITGIGIFSQGSGEQSALPSYQISMGNGVIIHSSPLP